MAAVLAPEDTLPWIEKYRPTSLSQVVSHHDIISTIKKFIAKDQLPHLLLHGPPGTGKTSTILALARGLYGNRLRQMVLELNASDDRGINVVRETIKNFAESMSTASNGENRRPPFGAAAGENNDDNNMEESTSVHSMAQRIKLVILDEADQMTNPAQMALRRIMEKYADRVRFCIVCNYVNKINPALQSRCTKFRFPPLPEIDLRRRTTEIAAAEGIQMNEEALECISRIACGDMRKVLNTLQSATMSHRGEIMGAEIILGCLGLPLLAETEEMFRVMSGEPFVTAYDSTRHLMLTKGYAMNDILDAVYRKCLMVDWPSTTALIVFPRLADIQSRLSQGADESLQLSSLISAFVEIRMDMEAIQAEK